MISNFILLVFEFFYFKRNRLILYFSFLVFLFSVFNYFGSDLTIEEAKNLTGNSINLLGILLGFCSAIFTVVITISTPEVNDAKQKQVKGLFNKKKTYLYDIIISDFIFLIIILGFLLIFSFTYPILVNYFKEFYISLFAVNISLTIFSVVKLIGTIFNFYLIISSTKNRPLE